MASRGECDLFSRLGEPKEEAKVSGGGWDRLVRGSPGEEPELCWEGAEGEGEEETKRCDWELETAQDRVVAGTLVPLVVVGTG